MYIYIYIHIIHVYLYIIYIYIYIYIYKYTYIYIYKTFTKLFITINHTQWLRGRASDSVLQEPGFEFFHST